ncbi:hypothetical protein VB797_22500, partial [Rivularia sp. UHCC 0363]|nr:hypothetical protein [Rivularia sp. UHCC 0363]
TPAPVTPITPAPVIPAPGTPLIPLRIRDRDSQTQTEQPQTIPARNYIGVGGNFGLSEDGDTALGDNGFTVFSKIGLTNNLSFRPAVTINDDAVFLIPITFDFPIQSSSVFRKSSTIAVPYIGGGAAVSTGDDSSVEFMLTGGVDVPLSDKFNANAGLNIGFSDETDVGIRLGVSYNF